MQRHEKFMIHTVDIQPDYSFHLPASTRCYSLSNRIDGGSACTEDTFTALSRLAIGFYGPTGQAMYLALRDFHKKANSIFHIGAGSASTTLSTGENFSSNSLFRPLDVPIRSAVTSFALSVR